MDNSETAEGTGQPAEAGPRLLPDFPKATGRTYVLTEKIARKKTGLAGAVYAHMEYDAWARVTAARFSWKHKDLGDLDDILMDLGVVVTDLIAARMAVGETVNECRIGELDCGTVVRLESAAPPGPQRLVLIGGPSSLRPLFDGLGAAVTGMFEALAAVRERGA